MPQMLEQLQLSIGTLGQDRRAERFHDLLDGNILAGELIFRRAEPRASQLLITHSIGPHRAHQTRPKAPMPTGCRSVYLEQDQQTYSGKRRWGSAYLLVISKVVPKIWARTNSAMMTGSSK